MKTHTLIILTALISVLCCFCFSACDILAINNNLTGEYQLVSFIAEDGKTYKTGDNFEDEEVAAECIILELQEFDSGFVDNNGKPVQIRKFNLSSSFGEGFRSMGFFQRKNSTLTFPSILDMSNDDGDDWGYSHGECTGKVSGNKINLTFPEGYIVKSAVLIKIQNSD